MKTQPRSLINPPSRRSYQPELKNIDVGGSLGTLVANAWTEPDYLNPIDVGTGATNRIGRKVQLKSFQVRWNTSSTTYNGPVRVLVIYDRTPQGAAPLNTDIFVANNFNSPMNLTNADRFVVISDTITPTYVSPVSGGQLTHTRAGSVYRKINLPQVFSGAGATIATCNEGAIFMICCLPFSFTGNGIGYLSRIRYTDV